MTITVGNTISRIHYGGKDHLVDRNFHKDIREFMRYKEVGSFFARKKVGFHWDGYNYLITEKLLKFPTGFLSAVYNKCVLWGYTVEIDDQRKNWIESIPITEFNSSIGTIDGEVWVARDYQEEAVKKIIYNTIVDDLHFPSGMLNEATNAGKTSMMALVLKNIPNANVVILSNDQSIYIQLVEFFSQVLPNETVGRVCSSIKGYTSKSITDFQRVTVCMQKTLLNRASASINVKSTLAKTNVLIVDESDESGAATYAKVVSMIPAYYRIFVSGTSLDGVSKKSRFTAMGMSGPIVHSITNADLIERGVSQKPKLKIYLSKTKAFVESYPEAVNACIVRSEERLQHIANILSEKNVPTLISVRLLDHADFLLTRLSELMPDLRICSIEGKSSDRLEVMADFKEGRLDVLIATTVIKRGINIPNIRRLIFAQGGKSATNLKQVVGRALRHDGEHDTVEVIDFFDTHKMLRKHSITRINTYRKEQFDIEYCYPNKGGKPI